METEIERQLAIKIANLSWENAKLQATVESLSKELAAAKKPADKNQDKK